MAAAMLSGLRACRLAVLGCLATAPVHAEDAGLVARGEYLARAADCVACHSAPMLLEGARLRNGTGAIVYMPPFGRLHDDAQLAAVATYVNHRFGNGTLLLQAADVAAIRRPAATSMPPLLLYGAPAAALAALLLAGWAAAVAVRRRRVAAAA